MKVNSTLTVKMLLVLATFIISAKSVNAWNYTGSGQWASVNYGSWTVYQDEWGSTAPCTLYANSASNWASAGTWNQSTTAGYPHVQGDPNMTIGNGSCKITFNFSGPSGSVYTLMADCWTAGMKDELMIEEAWGGAKGHWGTQIYSNVTIGGRLYASIWKASNGSNPVYIFTPSSQKTSGTTDIMAVFVWAKSKNLLQNSTLYEVSFGPEITSTGGVLRQFTMNSFSCAVTKSATVNTEESNTVDKDNSDVALFPNPFVSEINIRIGDPDQVNRIVVVDMLGKPVEIIDHTSIRNLQAIGSSLKTGMYVVQVCRLDKIQSFTIIKK